MQVSGDGGTTWTPRGRVPGGPRALAANGTSEVYVATDAGIHVSNDGGRTFAQQHALG